MDLSGCECVEQVPGRMGGVAVVLGSRVTPESVVEHSNGGFSGAQIAWMFSLPRTKVRKVLEYVVRHRSLAA